MAAEAVLMLAAKVVINAVHEKKYIISLMCRVI